jgi:hypothetical protein
LKTANRLKLRFIAIDKSSNQASPALASNLEYILSLQRLHCFFKCLIVNSLRWLENEMNY